MVNKYNFEKVKELIINKNNIFNIEDDYLFNCVLYLRQLNLKYRFGYIEEYKLNSYELCLLKLFNIKNDNNENLEKFIENENKKNIVVKNESKYILKIENIDLLKVDNIKDKNLIENIRMILENVKEYDSLQLKKSIFNYYEKRLTLTENSDKIYLISIIETLNKEIIK